METAILVLAAVAAAALVAAVVLLVALLRQRGRSRADLEAVLAHSRAETGELRRQLEELAGRVERPAPAEAEFVITSVGDAVPDAEAVPDRLVLGATLGEPLVKAAAFTHGVRRALSAESRNRIRFAMRQEVRRSRRERRREMKAAWRAHQARFREAQRADGLVDPA